MGLEESLHEAARALRTKPLAARALFVQVWRATRDPRLGALVDRLGETLQTPLEELPTKQHERAQALAAAFTTSGDETRASLLAATEVFARNAIGPNVREVVESWLRLEADPAIAHTALRLLEGLGAEGRLDTKLRRRLVAVLERHGDAGFVPALRGHAATVEGPLRARCLHVAERLAAFPSTPDDLGPVLDRLLTQLPHAASGAGPSPTAESGLDAGEALFDAVFRDPDDDGPRAVLADWLTRRGDVRGEFITLQLDPARAKRAKPRLAELLRLHKRELCGALARYVKMSGLHFERGFLVGCTLAARLPALPATALLEDVRFDYARVAADARLDRLRVAREIGIQDLLEVLPRCPELTTATLFERFDTPWALTASALASAPRSLSEVHLTVQRRVFRRQPEDPAPLEKLRVFLGSPLVAEAHTAGFFEDDDELLGSPPDLQGLEDVRIGAAPASLRELHYRTTFRSFSATFGRVPGGGWDLVDSGNRSRRRS